MDAIPRVLRCAIAVLMALTAVCWGWAVLRVAADPARSGPVEQGIVLGGWTLSLLPVHVSRRDRH